MGYLIDHPRLLFPGCFLAMFLAARFGVWLRSRYRLLAAEDHETISLVLSATLTLLGLIIGFTFSMATTRYDERKQYEEQEANAIGTEYVRLDLLPAAQAAGAKPLLATYLDQRIRWYQLRYGPELDKVNQTTTTLQNQLWLAVRPQAGAQPTPLTALVIGGMNDVLNSQGYTQAAWTNRLPFSAWVLMFLIALFSNGLMGCSKEPSPAGNLLLAVLPLIVAVALFLVADMDTPRAGRILVRPQNLISLSQSMPAFQ